MYNLIALALSNIPYAGQVALAQNLDKTVRTVLAANSTTHIDIINKLADDENLEVAQQDALARTTDLDILAKSLETCPLAEGLIPDTRMYILRNPLIPTDILVEATRDKSSCRALEAYCNPGTPEDERRHLTPRQARKLLGPGRRGHELLEPNRRARASSLVAANLWMAEEPDKWDTHIQNAILSQPETSLETLQTMHKTSKRNKLDVKTITSHPTYQGLDINTLSVAELLATNSPAAFLQVTKHPALTLPDITYMLKSKRCTTGWGWPLKQLVTRYGCGTLIAAGCETTWEGSEAEAAATVGANAIWYLRGRAGVISRVRKDYQEISAVSTILEENAEKWKTFLALALDWHGNMLEAAQVANKL